jgi:transmembrane sensor
MIAGDGDETAVLRREARRQVAQLLSGEAMSSDFHAADRWRRQSPAHSAAFDEALRLWKNFRPAARALLAEEGPPIWSPPPSQLGRRAILGGAGALAAATAVAYAVVDPPFGLWPSFAEFRADYRTATGEQRHVMLADDVSVRMNTQTSIAVPVASDGSDKVTLIDGEASFTVPPGSARPLTVVAEAGRTIATRARFDVRKIDARVCVTCFEGEVRIEQGARAAMVGANQQLHYDGAGLGQTLSVNAEEVSAWQDGILIFRFIPLSDVITEINRYRPGLVILLNAELGAKTVNGRFKIQRIDEALVWIEQVLGAKSRSLPGGIVLLS